MTITKDSVSVVIILLNFDKKGTLRLLLLPFKFIYLTMLSITKIICGQLLMNKCRALVK